MCKTRFLLILCINRHQLTQTYTNLHLIQHNTHKTHKLHQFMPSTQSKTTDTHKIHKLTRILSLILHTNNTKHQITAYIIKKRISESPYKIRHYENQIRALFLHPTKYTNHPHKQHKKRRTILFRKGEKNMLNQIILVGRLTTTPTPTDKHITLAVTRSYKNTNGEYETDFIPVKIPNSLIQNITEYTRKGDIIGVKGRIEQNTTTLGIEIIADKVTFLSSHSNTDTHTTTNDTNNLGKGEI